MILSQNFVGGRKNIVGDNTETAVPIIHQPIAGMTLKHRDFIREYDIEGLLQLHCQNMIRQAYVTPRLAGDGGRNGLVFMRKFARRDAPMMAAIARQDRIARMGVDRSFGRAHDAGVLCEANLYLAFEFSGLHMLRVTRNFSGKSAFSATAKYQRSASFVIF